MKKRSLLLLLILIGVNAVAQEKQTEVDIEETYPTMYIRAGAGYAMPHGGAVHGGLYSFNTSTNFPANGSINISSLPTSMYESHDLTKFSYTSGVVASAALGFNFSKHLGGELVANVGLVTKEAQTGFEDIRTQTTYNINGTQQANTPFFLIPSLVVQTGGKINVYARGGVVLPVSTKMVQTVSYNESTYNPADGTYVNTNVSWSETYSMYFTPGFAGATGIKFNVANSVQVWAEAGLFSTTLYYKESELTAYSENGVSYINQIPPSVKTSEYTFEGTRGNTMGPYPTSQVPFSNFNISAGISIDLF